MTPTVPTAPTAPSPKASKSPVFGMIDHIFKYGGRKLNIVLCTLNETFSTIIKISPSRYVCVDISIFQSSKGNQSIKFDLNPLNRK
ncbi:hypothetical protein RIR_jg18471.t1 [Rhizophagus irregularis DAOM 181602=DAOM 197198]|nr:hypothetical protein RIR_jg18471.t1 [Rhizophagus irregularis DAOM 181602=DAOM 197198]